MAVAVVVVVAAYFGIALGTNFALRRRYWWWWWISLARGWEGF